jgi:hypothetical protein
MRKHLNKHNFKRVLRFGLLISGVMLFISGMSGAYAQDVTQGYQADEELQNGIIVRIKPADKAKVEALSQEKEADMFGVVVSSSESPVSLSDPNNPEVFVASQGRYDVLVSSQNGEIKPGDGIVISSIKGVGMKSDDLHRILAGKALQGFSDNSNAEGHIKIADGRTVAIGRIKVDLSVKRNPAFSGDTIAGVPHALSRLAYAVTDKPVTAFRIYAGLAIMFLCILVAGAILYSGIHGGMSSVGRNPLAKNAIMRTMIGLTLTALIVVSIGLFAVYLLLKI